MWNRITILGRLGADANKMTDKSNTPYLKFMVATNHTLNKKFKAEWHRCLLYGKAKDILEDALKKGCLVFVRGEMKYGKFTDKKGETYQNPTIMVKDIRVLESLKVQKIKAGARLLEESEDDIPI